MNVLVLNPQNHMIRMSIWDTVGTCAIGREMTVDVEADEAARVREMVHQAGGALECPDLTAVRIPFGLPEIPEAEPLTDDLITRVDRLCYAAPLGASRLPQWMAAARTAFPDVPVVIVPETAFFRSAPQRETRYAVSLVLQPAPIRTGRHGLFHAGACRRAQAALRVQQVAMPHRIVSVCLEPVPELSAALGMTPLMWTGGSTPLEGLPGETTCGDLDAGAILTLADRHNWSAEQIDHTLCRESGLRGLTGAATTLERVLTSADPVDRQAADIFSYRLFLACGAGIAALDGLDAVVFSGRYATCAAGLTRFLEPKLSNLPGLSGRSPLFLTYSDSLAQCVAETAVGAAIAAKTPILPRQTQSF